MDSNGPNGQVSEEALGVHRPHPRRAKDVLCQREDVLAVDQRLCPGHVPGPVAAERQRDPGMGSGMSSTCEANDAKCLAGKMSGAIIAPVASHFMGYALYMYKKRTLQILRRETVRYDDQRGPVVLVRIDSSFFVALLFPHRFSIPATPPLPAIPYGYQNRCSPVPFFLLQVVILLLAMTISYIMTMFFVF
jgi:hypothetical protein